MNPSDIPEFSKYPAVKRFVVQHLDMQFDDVRTMLLLPLPKKGLPAGCNFATAAALCNLVSGISEVLFRPPGNPGPGERFKLLLECNFPWARGERRVYRARILYKYVRNPLAHELGLDKKSWKTRIAIGKRPLSSEQVKQLDSPTRPSWLEATLTRRGSRMTLSVPAFYWSVFELLRNLAKDDAHMKKANSRRRRG